MKLKPFFLLGTSILLGLFALRGNQSNVYFASFENILNKFRNKPMEVILTGDVMIGRSVMTKSLDVGDFTYPFKNVADTLLAADLVFINLENPVVSNCPRVTTGFKFCASPRLLEGLKFSGIDVATVANNHTLNYGKEGLKETEKLLTENGISATGLGNLVVKEVNGTKFGFLGFDFVSKKPSDVDLELVEKSDKEVDVLIVGVHWGVEYTNSPNTFQKEWARKLVSAGADVISGHHPHWVQTSEYIDGKPVFYSLGNFVFDQMWSENTRKGLAVRLTFKGSKLDKVDELPIYMKNWAQPEFVKE